MEFDFNNVVEKAKDAFDTVAKTTNRAVSIQKQQFEVSAIKSRLSKEYEALGRAYFAAFGDVNTENAAVNSALASVKDKIAELDKAEQNLAAMKNCRRCPSCATPIENESVYCRYCGAKVVFESEE